MTAAVPAPSGAGGGRRGLVRAIVALHTVSRRIASFVEGATALILLVVGVLIVIQVLSRFTHVGSLFWIEEAARLGMVWMTFLGAGFVAARGKHLRVDAIVGRLRPLPQTVARVVAELLALGVGLVLAIASAEIALSLSALATSSSGVSRGVLYLAALLGFAFVALASVSNLLLAIVDPHELERRESGIEVPA